MRLERWFGLLALLVGPAACAGACDPLDAFAGRWRIALASPGGELPFELVVDKAAAGYRGSAVNGGEAYELGPLSGTGERAEIAIAAFDASLSLEREDDRLRGSFSKVGPYGPVKMPLQGTRGVSPRFVASSSAGSAPGPDLTGAYQVELAGESAPIAGYAELEQRGPQVDGLLLTTIGDLERMEGRYEGSFLRLSHFDGSNAFLLHARVDGARSWSGTLWADVTIETPLRGWPTERRASVAEITTVGTATQAQVEPRFSLIDIDGRPVQFPGPAYRGKVVVLDVMGTWCTTCVDQAPLLLDWHRRHRDRGLELIAVSFEATGDRGRDGRLVREFRQRHGFTFPVALGGAAGSERDVIGFEVSAYPTTLFIGRDGAVRSVHLGFVGERSGEHHRVLVAEMNRMLERLLAEAPPPER